MKKNVFSIHTTLAVADASPLSSGLVSPDDGTNSGGYIYTDVDEPSASTSAGAAQALTGISNTGVAVGYYIDSTSGLRVADATADGSTFETLSLGTGGTEFVGANSSDAVVGLKQDSNGNTTSFLYINGNVTTITDPLAAADETFVRSINDGGEIAGYYVDSTGGTHGFTDSDGIFTTLDAPSATVTEAQGLDTEGDIVGFEVNSGVGTAVLDLRGTIYTLNDPNAGTASGEGTFGEAINDSGEGVGYYIDSTGAYHGFLYNAATGYTTIDDPNGVNTVLTGIDNGGEITGYYVTSAGVYNGFTVEAACYCPGTLISTAHGATPIECLAIGDQVKTISGALLAIRWIGRRAYAAAFARRNEKLWPVHIRAGALADHVPARDLFVSPNHALFLDGVLVDAGLLVNGVTITKAAPAAELAYYNIELDSHDVVFAEGAPAETFLDRDCRNMFQNAAEYDALYPEAEPDPAPAFFARRVEDGAALAAILARLAMRAGQAGSPAAAAAALSGVVEHADRHGLSGWATDEAGPVTLEIGIDGRPAARILANRARTDLTGVGDGTGRASFALAWDKPLDGTTRHLVTVQRAADGHVLPGGMIVLEKLAALAEIVPACQSVALLLAGIDTLLAGSGERQARETRFHTATDRIAVAA